MTSLICHRPNSTATATRSASDLLMPARAVIEALTWLAGAPDTEAERRREMVSQPLSTTQQPTDAHARWQDCKRRANGALP